MELETIYSIISFVAIIFSIFVSPYLAKIPDKMKKFHKGNTTLDGVNKDCDKVNRKIEKLAPVTTNTTKLVTLIIEAEQHAAYSGLEKLEYVLTNYHQYCIDNKFTFNKEIVTNCINELIDLTKSVNKRAKDLQAQEEERIKLSENLNSAPTESNNKGIYS